MLSKTKEMLKYLKSFSDDENYKEALAVVHAELERLDRISLDLTEKVVLLEYQDAYKKLSKYEEDLNEFYQIEDTINFETLNKPEKEKLKEKLGNEFTHVSNHFKK